MKRGNSQKIANNSIDAKKARIGVTIVKSAIYFYQIAISPYLGRCCRFSPSCSEYAKRAIEKHGFYKGAAKSIGRLLKCGPWHRGGIDPP